MNLTIKDIARMAGVSVSTVSKCINHYSDIGEDTRRKILDLMEQTGFRPSFSAKTLVSKRTHMIGVIFGHEVHYDFSHIYFTEILNSFRDAMGKKGYDFLLFSNRMFHEEGEDYLARCLHYNVDGCLVFAAGGVWEAVQKLDLSDIPLVGIDLNLRGTNSASVRVDNLMVGQLAAEHLLACGHRSIGYIGSQHAEPIYRSRENGFRTTLAEARAQLHEDWFVYAPNHTEQDGYDAAQAMLRLDTRPTALFAGSDLMAIGAIRAFKEAGFRLPDQMSIIGCDNIYAGRYIDPALTTVNQNKETIGEQAAAIMHKLILHKVGTSSASSKTAAAAVPKAANASSILIKPDVIVRSSVAVLPDAERSAAHSVHKRTNVLKLAEALGSVSKACEQSGVSRTQFYEYKRRFQQEGLDGLLRIGTASPSHPHTTPPEVTGQLTGLCLEYPLAGCARLSRMLKGQGHAVSAPTIQKLLNRAGLGTQHARLLALEKHVLEHPDELTAEHEALLVHANPQFRERHTPSPAPGATIAADHCLLGRFDGIGKVYLFCAVDTYSGYAFALTAVRKQPEIAAALLHNEVLSFYRELDLPVREILTDSSREYRGGETHPYELYLNLNDMVHRVDDGRSGPTNGFMERVKRKILEEWRSPASNKLAENVHEYASLDTLHQAFQDWLRHYNEGRPHEGYPNFGTPPLQRIRYFLSGKHDL
jgi:LacI family transcriptional regulator